MEIKKVSTLKINKLSRLQYEREFENHRIEDTALYLVPDDTPEIIQMNKAQYEQAVKDETIKSEAIYIVPDDTPNIVQMTKEDYDAAVKAETLDENTIYLIPDAEWTKTVNNATSITVTVEDMTEYYFPNATYVEIELPTDLAHYESWLYIGGTNATIQVNGGTCLGITEYAGSYNTSCAEVSIKDGRYLIATDCIS